LTRQHPIIAEITTFVPLQRHFITNTGSRDSMRLMCLRNRRSVMIRSLMLVVVAGAAAVAWAADQPGESSPSPKVFTAAQARAGKIAYESSCGLCHQPSMRGRSGEPGEVPDINSLPENMIKTIDQNGGQVPPLVGPRFMAHWGAKSAKDFVARVDSAIHGFPPRNTGSETSVQLTAYFLQMNGGKPGKIPLSTETRATLNAVTGQSAH
jgi:hypothetical protein